MLLLQEWSMDMTQLKILEYKLDFNVREAV